MTPATIRIRVLQAQSNELRIIRLELKDCPPVNMAELVETVRELQDGLKAAVARVQVATDRLSVGDA